MSKSPSTIENAGALIAMTDLFISAGAAILVVIAVLSPKSEDRVPLLSDLVMACPTAHNGFTLSSAQDWYFKNPGEIVMRSDAPKIVFTGHLELKSQLAKISLPPQLLHSIALIGADVAPAEPKCIRQARTLIAKYNRLQTGEDEESRNLPIFSFTPTQAVSVQ